MSTLGVLSYYSLLGVAPNATPTALREAYRIQIKLWHPDRTATTGLSKTVAHQRTLSINHAYGVLSDPIARKQYDSKTNQVAPTTTPVTPTASSVPLASDNGVYNPSRKAETVMSNLLQAAHQDAGLQLDTTILKVCTSALVEEIGKSRLPLQWVVEASAHEALLLVVRKSLTISGPLPLQTLKCLLDSAAKLRSGLPLEVNQKLSTSTELVRALALRAIDEYSPV